MLVVMGIDKEPKGGWKLIEVARYRSALHNRQISAASKNWNNDEAEG